MAPNHATAKHNTPRPQHYHPHGPTMPVTHFHLHLTTERRWRRSRSVVFEGNTASQRPELGGQVPEVRGGCVASGCVHLDYIEANEGNESRGGHETGPPPVGETLLNTPSLESVPPGAARSSCPVPSPPGWLQPAGGTNKFQRSAPLECVSIPHEFPRLWKTTDACGHEKPISACQPPAQQRQRDRAHRRVRERNDGVLVGGWLMGLSIVCAVRPHRSPLPFGHCTV